MKKKRSIYNLFFNILSIVLTYALGVIIPKLFIVNLGSETNGLVASIGQVFSYVGLLEAGIGATVIQALYKPIAENNRDKINQILSASGKYYRKIGIVYCLCVLLVAIIYPMLITVELPRWQVIGIICFSGLGNAINFLLQQNYVVLLSAEGKGYINTNLNLIVSVFVSLAKAILLLCGCNVFCVIGVQFAITLLRIVLMRCYIRRYYKWLNVHVNPDYSALSQQKFVMVQKISYFVYSNTDIVVLTAFCDLTVVSVYVIYNLIIGVVEGIVSAFTSSVIFALGQLYNENFEKFKKIYKMYDTGYMTIVFALFTVVYLCIMPFLSVYTKGVTDADYLDSTLALLFVILKMVTTLRTQGQNTIDFAGHFKETQQSAVWEAVLNIVVSLVGVYYVGIYGVIIGSIVSTLYRGIFVTNYANEFILHYNSKEKIKKYALWIVYIFIFVLVCVFKEGFIPTYVDGYMQWIFIALPCTIISVLVYGVFWIVMNRTEVADVWFAIKSILKGIISK